MNLQNLSPSKPLLIQLAITGVLALTFGWFVGRTAFYHIQSADQAFMKYVNNRTPENEAALNVERDKIQHMRDVDSLKAALLVFFVISVVHSLYRRKARLAAVSLLAACSTLLVYVGLPL